MAQQNKLSRRSFLKVIGALAGGAALQSCLPQNPATGTAAPSVIAPTLAPFPTSTLNPKTPVAIAQANSYDLKLVRQQVRALFDQLGGLQDIVRPGARVALKVNLTGGVKVAPPPGGATPVESYATHPAVVQAMAELLRDSGAAKIHIVESVWEWASYEEWGYVQLAKNLGAGLFDLNQTAPYTDYATLPVGKDWFIYEAFQANHLLEEVDVLVSIAKMKCHYLCGITQSMKNMVGMAPYKFYEQKSGDGYRTGFHGPEDETKTRLPRVVMDLNRARPIQLSLIDAIQTVEGGEGPWMEDLRLMKPGLLIGGKNPVSTDAVAVAAMGFDPTAEYPHSPFLRADNHLNLARQLGLGSNRLEDIDIRGASLDDVRIIFKPVS